MLCGIEFKWTVGHLSRVMASFSEYKRQRIVSDVEWTYSIFLHYSSQNRGDVALPGAKFFGLKLRGLLIHMK